MDTATATPTLAPDQAAILKAIFSEYDITLCIDRSGSMASSHDGRISRWNAAHEIATGLTAAALEIDDDGIDLITFGGDGVKTAKIGSVAEVDAIFAKIPGGGTPLNEALQTAFKVAGKSPKKDFIIVLTDGEPSGPQEEVAKTIAEFTKIQSSDENSTILFTQLGTDPKCTQFLQFLDDGLQTKFGAKFDIVDTMTPDRLASFPSFAHALKAAQEG